MEIPDLHGWSCVCESEVMYLTGYNSPPTVAQFPAAVCCLVMVSHMTNSIYMPLLRLAGYLSSCNCIKICLLSGSGFRRINI